MHTGNTGRQKSRAKGSGKEVAIQEFSYRDTANVEPEIYVIPVIIGTTGIITKT
jgi:hypothetical protein